MSLSQGQRAESLRQALEQLHQLDSVALFDLARNPSASPQTVLAAAQLLADRRHRLAVHAEIIYAMDEAREQLH